MGETYKLTYFNIRGLAEPIRLIFAAAGVEYEDNRIEKSQWPELKSTFEYGQLPVLEVGGKRLAQSNSIARYLARKFELAGADEWEAAKIDELVDVLVDIRSEWRKFFMEQDAAKKEIIKQEFISAIVPKYFSKIEAAKERNGGQFLVGQKLSWADILFVHFIDMMETTVDPDVIKNYPKIAELRKNVLEIPNIKAWIEKRPQTAM
jgi:glutathione S-transferase